MQNKAHYKIPKMETQRPTFSCVYLSFTIREQRFLCLPKEYPFISFILIILTKFVFILLKIKSHGFL